MAVKQFELDQDQRRRLRKNKIPGGKISADFGLNISFSFDLFVVCGFICVASKR